MSLKTKDYSPAEKYGAVVDANIDTTDMTLSGDSTIGDASGDSMTVNATSTFNAPINIGADDTGHDVTFYGATASSKLLWDESADDLIASGTAGILVASPTGGGLGYATGAGGAVTQATSRTTGVTSNTLCGAITLVSAAGSATPATFTVTNSTVAATDTVIVSQKSGADLYHILVTAVAAGSFNITFFTTGGTTTEQPVFNFSVIKAVAA